MINPNDVLTYDQLKAKCYLLETENRIYREDKPVVYNIGEKTMRSVFAPAGITDASNIQAVFDQIERALVALDVRPLDASKINLILSSAPPFVPPISKGIDPYCQGWNACRAAMLNGGAPCKNE